MADELNAGGKREVELSMALFKVREWACPPRGYNANFRWAEVCILNLLTPFTERIVLLIPSHSRITFIIQQFLFGMLTTYQAPL